jgi:hypothetical protein
LTVGEKETTADRVAFLRRSGTQKLEALQQSPAKVGLVGGFDSGYALLSNCFVARVEATEVLE